MKSLIGLASIFARVAILVLAGFLPLGRAVPVGHGHMQPEKAQRDSTAHMGGSRAVDFQRAVNI